MGQELVLYNALNTELMRMLRRDPKLLATITDQTINTLGTAIQEGFDVRKVVTGTKEKVELPESLQTHRDGLFATDKQILMLVESVISIPMSVHREVRRALVAEILKFYGNSARIQVKGSGSYEFLESLDETRKRHIQIPRRLLEIEYDEAQRRSLIKTPYTQNRIVVPGVDIAKDTTWKIAILHQKPGKMPRGDTPWMIDFRVAPEQYLLKYMEMANPYGGASHHQSARTARSSVI
jgi:hypothetical protein